MGQPELSERLDKVIETAEAIKALCRVPSISIGVLHHGKVVYTKSIGLKDIEKAEPADSESLYTLCSTSKTFVSAALAILMDEEKMAWDDPIGKYLPDFHPRGDRRVAEEATFNDYIRHSGGLANPVVSLLGPGGTVFVPPKDFMDVVDDTPTEYEGNPFLNRTWMYSNVAYGLLTFVIERLAGVSFAEFLQHRILTALGMHNTAVFEAQIANFENIAHPYCVARGRFLDKAGS